MSPQHTRKGFLAKLTGFAAAFGLAPRLLGKSIIPVAQKTSAAQAPFAVRVDARAVARASESL